MRSPLNRGGLTHNVLRRLSWVAYKSAAASAAAKGGVRVYTWKNKCFSRASLMGRQGHCGGGNKGKRSFEVTAFTSAAGNHVLRCCESAAAPFCTLDPVAPRRCQETNWTFFGIDVGSSIFLWICRIKINPVSTKVTSRFSILFELNMNNSSKHNFRLCQPLL
jgi:hypothetical protein